MQLKNWQRWAVPAVLAVLTAAAYCNSLSGPFVFDDDSIKKNPHIRRLWPLWEAARAPENTTLSRRPVTTFTFAVNYAISGQDVTSYHVLNVLIHLAAGLTLYGVLRRTLRRFAQPALPSVSPQSAEWLAAAVAGLWMLHPLQTDTVTYLVQRTEGLMGLFYLLTLYCAIRGFSADRPAAGRWWYAASVACCGLGMGCKEVMISAPLFVLLYDRTLVSGGFIAALRRRPGFYAGLAGTWALLAAFVLSSPHAANTNFSMADLTPWDYLKTQADVLVHYLRLSFWPSPLVLDYDDWPIARSIGDVPVVALLLVPAMLAASAWLVVRRSPAALPAALFFMVLAPTSSILPMRGEVAAERRMYLPLAGVLSLSVVGAYGLLRRAVERRARASSPEGAPAASIPTPPALLWGGRGVVAAAAVACLAGTLRRNVDYRSAVSLWTDTVAKRPGNARAWNNLGSAYVGRRRFDLAAECFTRSVEIGGCLDAPGNLGLALCDMGCHAEAMPHLLVALQVRADNPWGVYYNVGAAFMAQGRVDEAVGLLAEAARLAPQQPQLRAGYGHALIRQGRTREGLAETREALRLRPGWTAPMSQLAWVLATHPDPRHRDAAEAVRLAEAARELTRGKDPTVLDVLAAAYAEAGRIDDAVRAGLRAEELAAAAGRPAMARDFRRRVDAFYRAGRPYRDGPAGELREARITEP